MTLQWSFLKEGAWGVSIILGAFLMPREVVHTLPEPQTAFERHFWFSFELGRAVRRPSEPWDCHGHSEGRTEPVGKHFWFFANYRKSLSEGAVKHGVPGCRMV